MNYQRLYDQFILDRQSKPRPELTERHHIVPRKRGGTDDPSNIIFLAPSDHFFAHLLLARIYGGRLWTPVVLWCGGDKGNWRERKSRLNYAWLAKAAAKRLRGRGAWQYDPTVYRVCHADGREAAATQYDLPAVTGGGRSGINQLIKGRIKSVFGWRLNSVAAEDAGKKAGNHHPMADQRRYTFVHTSGERFTGTRFEFYTAYEVPRPNVCELANGKRIITRGWTLEGSALPRVGRAHAASQKRPLTHGNNQKEGGQADAG